MPLPYSPSAAQAPEASPPPKRARTKKAPEGFPSPARKPRPPSTHLKDPAKIAAATKPPGGAPRLEQVVLRTSHNINGQPYGPGVVMVREDIAAMLREQECRVAEGEERFYGRHAYLVGRGLKPRRVPYETFDDNAVNAPPIGTAHKGGGWSND